jgi:hypothetical protein
MMTGHLKTKLGKTKTFHTSHVYKNNAWIYAVVVTFVADSLEAGGLPGYPEVLVSLK